MRFALILFVLLSPSSYALNGGYYFGHSGDKHRFELCLDGEFVSQDDLFTTIRPTIRITKNAVDIATSDNCLVVFNPNKHEQDYIECGADPNSPLSGVTYLRNKKLYKKSRGEIWEMYCAKGCSNKVPQVLRLDVAPDGC